MLNNPGDDTPTSPAAESTENSDGSHIKQILLIAMVGGYLFGVVWLYAHLPWLAAGVVAVAVLMIFFGFIQRLRKGPAPPE